ncbi:MAG: hypothetical protein ACYDCO_01545 [Armatimonadota bacterium]
MKQIWLYLHDHLTTINSTPLFVLAIVASIVVFVLVMTVLHHTPSQFKKWLTIVLTFIAGLFFFLEYVLPLHTLKDGSRGNVITPYVQPVSDYIQYIFIWTIFLGLISLTVVHGRRLLQRVPGWHNSLAFFLALVAMLAMGFATRSGTAGSTGLKISYDSLFSGFLLNLDGAMFALLAFYIASAAYRAFRVRTVEAALLMISALVIMLGFVSFGVAMTSWIPIDQRHGLGYLRIEQVSLWILNWINMPAQRAVGIGVQIGAVAMALRIWLSLERGAFFSKES